MKKDVNELLDMALKETKNVEEGRIFTIRDLFIGWVWKSIPLPIKIKLGIIFAFKMSEIKNVEIMNKTKAGHQQYKKIVVEV